MGVLHAELAHCGMVVAPSLISRDWPANKIDWISQGRVTMGGEAASRTAQLLTNARSRLG
ncbi:hypothetical protein AJ87_41940 [Rhizobium yanglingense]|nr:hypothetical protein AJ87_41940 [Rhizobium yanglingense]